MEHKKNQTKLKLLVLCAGLLGAGLRMVLYTTGMDSKGLLVAGHWAHAAIWILTFAVSGILVLCCRGIRGPEAFRDAYPASALSAAGALLGAVGFLATGLKELPDASFRLDLAAAWMCFVSAAALLYAAVCRFWGKKPFFAAHALVCITFALRMVCQYRLWSSDPQLQDYCFYMSAHVGLMLSAYHLAAFDAEQGHHRTLWFLGLVSAYLCLLCLWGSGNPLFMLCCALWVLTNLSSLTLRKRGIRPRMEHPSEEDDTHADS